MSLSGFHPLWDKILSQNLQARRRPRTSLRRILPYKGTADRGYIVNRRRKTTATELRPWYSCLHNSMPQFAYRLVFVPSPRERSWWGFFVRTRGEGGGGVRYTLLTLFALRSLRLGYSGGCFSVATLARQPSLD
jgi:hypothetical protein